MSHHHHHKHNNDLKNLGLAFIINFLFTILEVIGGLLTNSLSILSDAIHDLGDSFSLGLAWYLQKKSKKGRTHKFTYGYRRFSLLGALINGLILSCGSVYIIIRAIPRLIEPEVTEAKGMMLLAVIGIVVNGYAAYRTSKGESQNERVVSLHLLEDVLGWVAVLIGGIVIYYTSWYSIDPILSILIALYVLFNVVKNLKVSLEVILQAKPRSISIKEIEAELNAIDGVKSYHDIHLWSLDGEKGILTLHLVVEEKEDQFEIKKEAKERLHALGIEQVTLEIEREGEHCE